jgi:hypothetical protein
MATNSGVKILKFSETTIIKAKQDLEKEEGTLFDKQVILFRKPFQINKVKHHHRRKNSINSSILEKIKLTLKKNFNPLTVYEFLKVFSFCGDFEGPQSYITKGFKFF